MHSPATNTFHLPMARPSSAGQESNMVLPMGLTSNSQFQHMHHMNANHPPQHSPRHPRLTDLQNPMNPPNTFTESNLHLGHDHAGSPLNSFGGADLRHHHSLSAHGNGPMIPLNPPNSMLLMPHQGPSANLSLNSPGLNHVNNLTMESNLSSPMPPNNGNLGNPMLPANEDEPPLYVNAKQYHRILKRRAARAKLEEALKGARQRKVCCFQYCFIDEFCLVVVSTIHRFF
jgi:hypothetical protein